MRRLRSYSIGKGTGAVTPALPTGWQTNDMFVLVCEASNADTITAPSGYTEHPNSPVAAAGTRLAVFYKRATGSESAPTVADAGNHLMVIMLALEGVVTSGTIFAAVATGTSSGTTFNCPDVSTTADGQLGLLIVTGSADSGGTEFGQISNFTITGFEPGSISIPWQAGSDGDGGHVTAFVGVAAASGTTLDASGTIESGSQSYMSLVFNMESNDDLQVAAARITTVIDLGVSGKINVGSAQIITVLTDPISPPVNARRRNFMNFSP